MADGMPPIAFSFSPEGAPVVVTGGERAADLAQAIALVPALADPEWVVALAQVANHLAQGDRYRVIVHPEAFRDAYLAARAAEDPAEPPAPGQIRLSNYGIPDFALLARPRMEGGVLVFCAENTVLGIPYRATMQPGQAPDYRPLPMVD